MKTGNRICIDTNAYSNFLRGDKSLRNVFKTAEFICIPIFVIGELLTGFKRGSKKKENISTLEKFLNQPQIEVLNANFETAEVYAQIKYELRIKGKHIPENDIWIAAVAIQNNLPFVSMDSHFRVVKHLNLIQGPA